MATILQQNQQDEEQNQAQGQQGTAVSSAQSSNISGQPATSSGASPSQRQASTSGRFTNIQNFIRANEGNQLGQQVAGKVQESAQGAQEKLGKTQEAFQGQIGQVAQGIQASRDAATQAVQNLSGAGDYNVSDDVANQAIENLRSGINLQYQGPSGLGNQQQLAAEAQNLYGIGKASQDASGRSALLQRFFGRERPTYTAGQTTLDNLLLGTQNKGLAQVRQASRQFGGQLRDAQQQALTNVMQQQQSVKDAQEFARQQAQTAQEQSYQDLQKEAEQFLSAEQLRKNTLPGDITANLSPGIVRGRTEAITSKSDKGSVTVKPIDFALEGFKDTVISGRDLANLGLINFQSELGNVSSLTPEQARQFAGRANTVQASQLNALRGLLNMDAIQTGPQLQAGSYSGVDQGRLSQINQEFSQEIAKELAKTAASNPGLQGLLSSNQLGDSSQFSGTGLGGPSAIDPVRDARKAAYNRALENLMQRYRPSGFSNFG